MPINISNIKAVVEAKDAVANSTNSTAEELVRILRLANTISQTTDALVYAANTDFPVASESNAGNIVYDSGGGKFYFSTGSDWQGVSLGAAYIPSSQAQGSNYGYVSGGASSSGYENIIDKFPFSSDANATDVGDLTVARNEVAGQSSSEYGYTSGGYTPVFTPKFVNIIDKFSFSSDGNATDVGNLTVDRRGSTGQSSTTYGYNSGGYNNDSPPSYYNNIEKFSFSTDGNATDVGDLTVTGAGAAGQSSTDYGYTSGRTLSNVIDKFPFSSDANATDVGDLTLARYYNAGQSSYESGYTSGGTGPVAGAYSNIIDKFPFSSDANATDVGDLTVGKRYASGQSSTSHGYSSGGYAPTGRINIIDKFPFSSDANATDVGDITVARYGIAGQQY